MPSALTRRFQNQSIRFKIIAGYLLITGLCATGLGGGFIWGEHHLEEPAILQQQMAASTLLQLNALQEIVLENKLSLLPYVRDPSTISDSGHRLTAKSQQLRTQLGQSDWAHLSALSARGDATLATNMGIARCRQAAVAYDDMLNQLLSERALGQVPSQLELLQLLSSSAVQKMEYCALDLQRLIASAEASQLAATEKLMQARRLEKQLAIASLLVCIVIAVVLALQTSGQITYPLQQASQVAKQISESNNFDLRVKVPHQDELGILADSFNGLLQQVQTLLHEQQLAQQQLEQYSAHLESTVAERTQALTKQNLALEDTLNHLQKTQSQLIQAEKMSGLGQMVAGIAHEINNPVNFIHGNLSYAQGYVEDVLDLLEQYQYHYPKPPEALQQSIDEADLPFLKADAVSLMQSMKTGTTRIREIVLSLRNFSRLDETAIKRVNLHEGIESTLMILKHRLKANPPEQEIEIVRSYGDVPLVTCHASQINQVFMNILNNAIDALASLRAADSPTPQIMISTSVESAAHPTHLTRQQSETQSQDGEQAEWVVTTIADNGSGMSAAVQARLFEPFFTTKPVGQGTGLGLSVSYQIVTEQHQGQLRCKSRPQLGTEFQVWLPLLTDAASPETATNQASHGLNAPAE